MQRAILTCLLLSSVLLLFSLSTYAQEENVKADSLKKIKRPTGLRIGTDLIALGKTIFDNPLTGWELNADIDVGRYYLAVDYGSWARKDSLRNGYYDSDGRYWRIGLDANLLTSDPDRNMVFVGFRYGHSSFDEYLTYDTPVDDFGNIQTDIVNSNAKAGWLEMTAGLRVKIWKPIWMGYTARMKLFPVVKGSDEIKTYEIPGYGKTSKAVYWGFNYQIFYMIPLQKQK